MPGLFIINDGCFPVFVFDLLLATLLLVSLFKCYRFPIFRWTGQHTLVYYFLCGGIPLLVSKGLAAIGMGYNGFLSLLLAFVLVYAIATVLVWLIYRYVLTYLYH